MSNPLCHPSELCDDWYDLSRENRLYVLENNGYGDTDIAKYYRKRIAGWTPKKPKKKKKRKIVVPSEKIKEMSMRRNRWRLARVRMGLI